MPHTYTVTYRTYSCPRCSTPVATHEVDKLHVESPFLPCRTCGAEVYIPTAREWETLTPEQQSSYWSRASQLGCTLIVPSLLLGGLIGFLMVGWLGIRGDQSLTIACIAACALAAVAIPLALVAWVAKRRVWASRRRMADPAYRAKVLAIPAD